MPYTAPSGVGFARLAGETSPRMGGGGRLAAWFDIGGAAAKTDAAPVEFPAGGGGIGGVGFALGGCTLVSGAGADGIGCIGGGASLVDIGWVRTGCGSTVGGTGSWEETGPVTVVPSSCGCLVEDSGSVISSELSTSSSISRWGSISKVPLSPAAAGVVLSPWSPASASAVDFPVHRTFRSTD